MAEAHFVLLPTRLVSQQQSMDTLMATVACLLLLGWVCRKQPVSPSMPVNLSAGYKTCTVICVRFNVVMM